MNPDVTHEYVSEIFSDVNKNILSKSGNKYVISHESEYNPNLSDYAYMFTLEEGDRVVTTKNSKGRNRVGKKGEIEYESIMEVEERKVALPEIVTRTKNTYVVKQDSLKNMKVDNPQNITIIKSDTIVKPYVVEYKEEYEVNSNMMKENKNFVSDMFTNVLTSIHNKSMPLQVSECSEKKNSDTKKVATENITFNVNNSGQKVEPIHRDSKNENLKKNQNDNKRTSSIKSDKPIINETKPEPKQSIVSKNGVDDKVSRIQGLWKSKRDSKIINLMREKVFIIQRSFRKYLIDKYDLPDNYFYNEKFLKSHHEKFEKNFIENMKILFPAAFVDDSCNLTPTMPVHNAYESEKIHLFAKILDLDLMVETDEVYEYIWAKSFDKLYNNMLNSSPLQIIALGCSHTIGLNSKGRVYSFGWNNYGQCGIPINCIIV